MQKCAPAPNARWGLFNRLRFKRSGSLNWRGSRFAAPSINRIACPWQTRTPQISISSLATRPVNWTGLSKRSNSSTAFRMPQQRVHSVADQVSSGLVPGEKQRHALRVELLFRQDLAVFLNIKQQAD